MREVLWNSLVEGLQSGKCVLVLGPDVSAASGTGVPATSARDAFCEYLAAQLREEGLAVGETALFGIAQQYEDTPAFQTVKLKNGVRGERPKMTEVNGKGMIVPMEKFGIKFMSIGLLVNEKDAIVWRGPMASSAIKQFVTDVLWEELDYLVIDMPPGTGDIHLTLVQTVPVTGAIVVTTPQDIALADAKKAVAMFGQAQIKVPIIGLVENMAYFTPAELPDNKYYIFGKDGGKRLADEFELNFLGQIPLVQSIREGGDYGKPVMVSDDLITKKAFEDFTAAAVRSISMRNAEMPVAELLTTVV